MKTRWSFRFVAASIALLSFVALPGRARAQDANAISSRTAEVGGVTLHYLTAGHGPALILLHGYTQTSRMWRPIIPQLAGKFTVIAPDLPGIGDSSIPKDGMDMKIVVEPTGALAAAALLEGKLDARGKRVGVIISGGNVDVRNMAALGALPDA